MNKVILLGNLTRDPEMRYTNSGTPVAEITIANNRKVKEKEEVVFVDVTVWGKQAEILTEYFVKGSQILIEGRISQDSWEDKETGKKRTKTFVTCDNFNFTGKKSE